MPTLKYEGKSYEVDKEGYLLDWQEWNEKLAIHMAKQDSLELTEAHWEVIKFLRGYFEKYRVSPAIKVLIRNIGTIIKKDTDIVKYLYELYPAGPSRQGCRYAGIPKPISCCV